MRAVQITVADLKKKPEAYENERIEVTVELERGETAADGVAAARLAIARIRGEVPEPEEVESLIADENRQHRLNIKQLRRIAKIRVV